MSGLTRQRMAAIREELERLGTETLLTPETVVEAARDPRSPLHSQFEWDDEAAGEAYRIQQARALIKRVRVDVVRADQTVIHAPVFVRAPSGGEGYALTQAVAVSAPDRRQVVLMALAQCRSILRNLAAQEVDELVEHIDRLSAQLREQQAA